MNHTCQDPDFNCTAWNKTPCWALVELKAEHIVWSGMLYRVVPHSNISVCVLFLSCTQRILILFGCLKDGIGYNTLWGSVEGGRGKLMLLRCFVEECVMYGVCDCVGGDREWFNETDVEWNYDYLGALYAFFSLFLFRLYYTCIVELVRSEGGGIPVLGPQTSSFFTSFFPLFPGIWNVIPSYCNRIKLTWYCSKPGNTLRKKGKSSCLVFCPAAFVLSEPRGWSGLSHRPLVYHKSRTNSP